MKKQVRNNLFYNASQEFVTQSINIGLKRIKLMIISYKMQDKY